MSSRNGKSDDHDRLEDLMSVLDKLSLNTSARITDALNEDLPSDQEESNALSRPSHPRIPASSAQHPELLPNRSDVLRSDFVRPWTHVSSTSARDRASEPATSAQESSMFSTPSKHPDKRAYVLGSKLAPSSNQVSSSSARDRASRSSTIPPFPQQQQHSPLPTSYSQHPDPVPPGIPEPDMFHDANDGVFFFVDGEMWNTLDYGVPNADVYRKVVAGGRMEHHDVVLLWRSEDWRANAEKEEEGKEEKEERKKKDQDRPIRKDGDGRTSKVV
ncbi:hypothetical protein CERZMDRAFT_101560 [Cercospora zeae-maydis SCOH1-5]|uniref:Uncharacterized protein n=1 Tax=Cercospora zeae-maydis SCOH1-5 TaxID=717836 RepID=A0A6A6F4T0_9PEZI|nr:hypothetical protein CERZMDRAFT_101560 [Cercospora zeae-maydis SCOH1-5]